VIRGVRLEAPVCAHQKAVRIRSSGHTATCPRRPAVVTSTTSFAQGRKLSGTTWRYFTKCGSDRAARVLSTRS
jgi:hypothetical protein